ncbi:hypothetical protein ABZ865_12465 [Streptomyces sp. NPDC047085]|uniref:hypothetical protein n=1 Tax=Streptomyces sp. NPDC047085 TaxID=3155140 RepID=UPI0034065936
MGERQSGGAGTADARLEEGLAAAFRTTPLTPGSDAERHAVAAFRAARDAGLHGSRRARTRRRDDWRPREPWRLRLSVKTTLSVFAASLTLGGVAVAAIGAAGSSSDGAHGDGRNTHPVTSAPERSGADASAGSSAGSSAHPDRPDTAKDTLAHCRAYEQVKDRGKALDATAWQRLLEAAGGEDHVAAYCTAQLARAAETHDNGQGDSRRDSRGGSENAGQNNGQTGTENNGQNAGKGTDSKSDNSGKADNSAETNNGNK